MHRVVTPERTNCIRIFGVQNPAHYLYRTHKRRDTGGHVEDIFDTHTHNFGRIKELSFGNGYFGPIECKRVRKYRNYGDSCRQNLAGTLYGLVQFL